MQKGEHQVPLLRKGTKRRYRGRHGKTLRKYFPVRSSHVGGIYHRFYHPLGQGIYLSFCKFTTVNNAKWVGVSNYFTAFQDATFAHAFWFTIAFGGGGDPAY